jgi:hypothetical protein
MLKNFSIRVFYHNNFHDIYHKETIGKMMGEIGNESLKRFLLAHKDF